MRSTKIIASCLQSSMVVVASLVWGCMSAVGTGEMRFIEGIMDSKMYCDILKQNMKPSLQKLGRTAVFSSNGR